MFDNKHTQGGRGFTLLEMALVLFILVVIAGLAIPMTSGLVAQERLKAAARTLQDYAVSARRLAVTEGRPYDIVFHANSFTLERLGADDAKEEDTVGRVQLASNVRYSLQRWGKDEFAKPAKEQWVFRSDGICEPIRVHFESKDGWIEYSFNPLTARPQDESYHFQ